MNIPEYEDYMELMEEDARLKHIANEKDITIRLLSKRCRELGDNPIPIEALDETLTCSRCANYGIIKVFATEEGHIASSGCVCPTNAALEAKLAAAREGWPHAIERAIAAEAENKALKADVDKIYRQYVKAELQLAAAEKVVEAAKENVCSDCMYSSYPGNSKCVECRHGILKQALAAYEGEEGIDEPK